VHIDTEEDTRDESDEFDAFITSILKGNHSASASTQLWWNYTASVKGDIANLSEAFGFAWNGDLKELRDAGAAKLSELTSTGKTLLHYAVMGNQVEVAKWLISKGVPVDATENERNFTAFHFAASEGHLKMAKMLANFSANLNCK
jgi:ankyrin repeat protein